MGMLLLAGLGNPGPKFNNTPHNAGFAVLDFFAKKNGFPEFTESKKYQSLVCDDNGILLAKPQTFMNESGVAVKKIVAHYKLADENLIVVHDDTDLPLGKIKFSKDSGPGGHKGVESIIQHLGNNHFIRLKIGVATGEEKAADVVLKKFSPQEQEIMGKTIATAAEALDCLLENGLEKAMNKYHQ